MTNRSLDAAVQGTGFFLVRYPQAGSAANANDLLLTRDGRFRVAADGALVTGNGARVQGWRLDTSSNTIPATGPVQDVLVPLGTTLPPKPTTRISVSANLDASAADGSSLKVPVELYDSAGGSHLFTVVFTKQSSDNWSMGLTTTDPAAQQPLPAVSPASLHFTNGVLDPSTPGSLSLGPIDFTSGVPQLGPINWTLGAGDLTQYAQPAAVLSVTQDGGAAATLSDVRIGDGGKVIAMYSNGVEAEIARLALTAVRNTESLIPAGENYYKPGSDTFMLPPAPTGPSGYGGIIGSALETSNVDLAEQFTQLLTYQRGYQASARVITTTDELVQEALSIKR
jgi:flagellar hook protein FlgE